MPTQHSDPCDETDTEVGNPLQFRLIDLFAVLTLCALIMSMLAPFARQMRSESRLYLMAVFCSQAIVITLVMLRAAKRRKKLLNVSGRRIGIGYCGELKWRHAPVATSLVVMMLLAIVQMGFAVAVAINFKAFPLFIQQFQLSVFFGLGCSRYIWRVYPNSVEFYENGISADGTILVPWERISVRDSQFFPDRIVMVIRTTVGSVDADTSVVQVADSLRPKIITISKRNV